MQFNDVIWSPKTMHIWEHTSLLMYSCIPNLSPNTCTNSKIYTTLKLLIYNFLNNSKAFCSSKFSYCIKLYHMENTVHKNNINIKANYLWDYFKYILEILTLTYNFCIDSCYYHTVYLDFFTQSSPNALKSTPFPYPYNYIPWYFWKPNDSNLCNLYDIWCEDIFCSKFLLSWATFSDNTDALFLKCNYLPVSP